MWTFHLRRGVAFHHGYGELTADDVVYSLRRAADPQRSNFASDYADVASFGARFLRVLMLLPGGDRALGLKEMLQARERGILLGGEADYQLHFIYLWYEKQPARARELLQGLDTRYPSNSIFLERVARIDHGVLQSHRESAAAWQTLIERAAAGRVHASRRTEVRARTGLASELIELSEIDRARIEIERALALDPNASDAIALRRKVLTR